MVQFLISFVSLEQWNTALLSTILNTALLVHSEPTEAKTRATKRVQEKEDRTYRIQG